MRKSIASLFLITLLCVPVSAVPVVIYDDFAGVAPTVGYGVSPIQFVATRFTTGAGAVNLTSLVAALVFLNGDAAGTGLTVSLYDNLGGVPGAVIASLIPAGPLPSAANPAPVFPTFSPVLPIALSAATTYWVAAETSVASGYGWLTSTTVGPFAANQGLGWLAASQALPALRVNGDDALAAGVPELSLNWPGFVAMGLLLAISGRRRG